MDILMFLMANWATILEALLGIVGVFALVATVTPNTADNKIAKMFLDIINFLGANLGKAGAPPGK
ncbi:hypothetical protein CMI37_11270 [Candidatus Pacearchaeota archaeon]|nr:hypothetical protein [Candidatus Pacearchaeota archaeon]|tara:strand:- start:764 stop:958 length:195 start_codon:yes stop_codon:yes gene_type:complete